MFAEASMCHRRSCCSSKTWSFSMWTRSGWAILVLETPYLDLKVQMQCIETKTAQTFTQSWICCSGLRSKLDQDVQNQLKTQFWAKKANKEALTTRFAPMELAPDLDVQPPCGGYNRAIAWKRQDHDMIMTCKEIMIGRISVQYCSITCWITWSSQFLPRHAGR